MTEYCIKSISPDGISGMIFALEGIQKTMVLLNGPMGCRFYHSSTSEFLTLHPLLYLPDSESGERVPVDYNYLNDWFFRQERVPCTYLDGYDYVYGTKEKVYEAVCFIRDHIEFDLFAIVNSPGAALIGDHLYETACSLLGRERLVMLESPGYSTSFEEGYAEASLAVLKQVGSRLWEKADRTAGTAGGRPAKTGKKVNLLGISIWHRYWEGDLYELKRLLALCGVEVNSAFCAGSSRSELSQMPEADLTVVTDPQMGTASAVYLKEQAGIPFYICETLPIGFSATEKMVTDIAGILGVSAQPALEEAERARALAWVKINGIHHMYGKPRGIRFFISASPAQEKAYSEFFTKYLGMKSSGAADAELVFSNANVISELKLANRIFCGIEITLPGMGYVDLVRKTHFGIEGALFLIEQVLNGMMSRL